MSKKNIILIVVAIIVCGVLFIGGLVFGIFTFVNKLGEEYYFTTEETHALQDLDGYDNGYE